MQQQPTQQEQEGQQSWRQLLQQQVEHQNRQLHTWQHHQQQQQQHLLDRRVGLISIAMWLGTAVRVYTALTLLENIQSLIAMTTMYLLVIHWPTYATESYCKWRLPALSFLRVFLVALPYNFSTSVFDAIAPTVATGRLALVANTFQAFLAVRIALLTFTSLGWRVPFRLHLLLQTINVGLLVGFGLHPYCASKLLSSSELQGAASAVHNVMTLFASVFLPSVAVSSPQGDYAQRLAFLLFCWAVLGWLLPTLLLLPKAEATNPPGGAQQQQQQQQPPSGLPKVITQPVSKLLGAFEQGLTILQLPWLQQRRQQQATGPAGMEDAAVEGGDEAILAVASFVLAWCVVLLTAWLGACLAAGLLA